MPIEIKIGILNNKDNIIITEDTGNYNAISNPGGWGAPNDAYTNPPVTAISLAITLPGAATSIGASNLLGTTYFTTTDRAYNLFTDPSSVVPTFTLQDGVWKYVVTYTISTIPPDAPDILAIYVITKYALRTNEIRCEIGKLALGDMSSNSFEEVKTIYDKMVQAFECEEYVLAQELYQEIKEFFTDCSPYSNKSCGC